MERNVIYQQTDGNVVDVPFAQRLACTINEACRAIGLGRTKLYELISEGRVETTMIGRRRLVLVRSLLALVDENAAGGAVALHSETFAEPSTDQPISASE
jgi:excisionase family DNA binding protein